MEKRRFGKTGLHVSVLGFGAAPIAFLKSDATAAVKMINDLLDGGMNLIDTAMAYPGSHEFVGQHLSSRRDDYVLVSKCGHKLQGLDAPPWSPQAVTEAVDRALKQMKIEQIDVMLLHSCDLATLQKGEAMAALVKAREAGKIRFAGYSGDNEAAAYAATLSDVAVIETSINIADQRNIDLVLPDARANDVGIIAKRPIANAAWKDLSSQQGMYQKYAATYSERLAKMAIDPADLGFTGEAAEVWPEIALRFTLSQPGLTTAIVGTTNPDNAKKNVALAEKGPLPPQAIQRLRDAFVECDSEGAWTGQT
ncbi:MAG TPA: aldo/keto reductase [Tepidisphaeraceae bacterium]|jgi:aryl-alcohol dehydrogenase-like predicted oxidoreductase